MKHDVESSCVIANACLWLEQNTSASQQPVLQQ